MSDVFTHINELRADLLKFVTDLMAKMDWDIVVPVMRKGRFVIMNQAKIDQSKIRLFPFYDIPKLSEKKIIIVDDKAWHGHTMQNRYREVIWAGASPENVKTAVFVKHTSCEFPIDFYRHELEDSDYLLKEATLSVYYDSLCHQLDPDHLVAAGIVNSQAATSQISEQFPLIIKKNTQDLGIFYFQSSNAELWGRVKFAVVDIPLSKVILNDLLVLLEEEGVQKVRFCLERSGEIFIVPIFCPKMRIEKKECMKILKSGERMCEIFSLKVPRTSDLCRDCINFNVQSRALKEILMILSERLKNTGFAIEITNISWPELEYKHSEIRPILDVYCSSL